MIACPACDRVNEKLGIDIDLFFDDLEKYRWDRLLFKLDLAVWISIVRSAIEKLAQQLKERVAVNDLV